MEEYTLIISLLSFIVALTTLFFTHIKPPKIKLLIGNSCKIYYNDYDGEKHGFGIYLPTDFLNTSNKTGTVLKTAIVLHSKNQPSERYFMIQKQFSKLDVTTNKWVYDEMAHSIVIPPKSSANKIIWYLWNNESNPKLKIQKGDYILSVYFWTKIGSKPENVSCELSISQKIENILNERYNDKLTTTVEVQINKEFDNNKFISLLEENKLLK
jgi:hypothetical protein